MPAGGDMSSGASKENSSGSASVAAKRPFPVDGRLPDPKRKRT